MFIYILDTDIPIDDWKRTSASPWEIVTHPASLLSFTAASDPKWATSVYLRRSHSLALTHRHALPILPRPVLSLSPSIPPLLLPLSAMPALVEQPVYSVVHHASLIDPAMHSPATLELTDLKMSRTVIGQFFLSLSSYKTRFLSSLSEYAIDTVIEAVDYAMGRPESSTRGRSLTRHHRHNDFVNFVNNVLYKAEVKFPVLLVSLVYIHRAKPHLQIALEQWACERVFMGALILANKVHLSSSSLLLPNLNRTHSSATTPHSKTFTGHSALACLASAILVVLNASSSTFSTTT
jgi:hypothetical protein